MPRRKKLSQLSDSPEQEVLEESRESLDSYPAEDHSTEPEETLTEPEESEIPPVNSDSQPTPQPIVTPVRVKRKKPDIKPRNTLRFVR